MIWNDENNNTEEEKSKRKLVEQINKIEFPYRNILFKVYIQGKSLVTVASEMNYSYVHVCREHGIALNKFDEMIWNVIEWYIIHMF